MSFSLSDLLPASHLRATVRAFGEAAGMPFLELDDEGAAAVRLENGARFELEYVPQGDRLLLHVDLGAPLPADPAAWTALLRQNTGLVSSTGFSMGLGQVDGADRVLLLASLPAGTLTADALGETAVALVAAAEACRNRLNQTASTGADTGAGPAGLDPAFLRA